MLRTITFVLLTAGGVFSPDRLDAGTAVLFANMPPVPPGGDLLDLGSGWGPISLSMALAAPHATVWAVDVNRRALELTAANAEAAGLTYVSDEDRGIRREQTPLDLGRAAHDPASAEVALRPARTAGLVPLAILEERYTLVEAEPLTGRYHQIRRHLEAVAKRRGWPVLRFTSRGGGLKHVQLNRYLEMVGCEPPD